MSDWEESDLSTLGQIFDGPHATPSRVDSGPYFLNIASLSDGRLDLTKSDHVSAEDFAKWTRRVTPQEGDLLFSYETRLGEAALMPPGVEACLGRRMALIRPNRGLVDPRFLLYLYLSPSTRSVIEQETIHGATVNRLALTTMGRWKLRVPPLRYQRSVAEVLGALDDKMAANSQLATVSRSSAVSYASNVAMRVPLSELVCLSKKTVDPATLGGAHVAHFSLPAFDSGRSPVVEPAAAIQSQKFLFDESVVLLSKLNPRFPRVWHVGQLPVERALASTEFLVLVPKNVSTSLLWAALSQEAFSLLLDAKVAGTSGSHQRVKPGDALATPVADIRLLSDSTSRIVSGLVELADSLVVANRTLAALRDTLLPPLMSGKLRVRDAERAVSEVL